MVRLAEAVCLVTGATGFVGGALVRALLRSGVSPDRLRCLVRDPAAAAARGLPAESLRTGDITDADAVRRAVVGADLVFHLAGMLKGARAADYFAVNRDGTRHLVAAIAAAAAAPAFLVHVSSLAAAGPSRDGSGSEAPPDRCRPVSAYGESKRQGEVAIAGAARHFAIVRPPVVYGSGDAATQLLFRQARGFVTAVPPRPQPLSVVHVDDVVTALLAVAERRPAGALLPLDGPERTDTHALLRAIAAACGRRARLLPVPLAVAGAAATVCDWWARLRGRPAFFNADKVRELAAAGWVADASSTRRDLAWQPQIGLVAGLAAVAASDGFGR